ncbi:cell death abnormality protein 1-like isoform X2 [Mercenaria mercenaria]|uniref:cell death abnormality protein 1-like isoform X2 n=1 Tax=Mercenaria mercenaria TaxID=6596 RepID=UPI00234E5CA9|nr:cell death abnormality protein 1-like isoform X2 [Mercenaria mercenaria]
MTRNYANWKSRIVWTFLTTIYCTSLSDAQCSGTSSGIKRFGPDCRHACHCMSKEQCDSSTGDCTSGCDFEWAGPGCQYKNIALNELARHIDNINPPEHSVNANDRNLSTCSFTDTAEAPRAVAPWWTLWLPYYVRFKNLVIVTKKEHLSHFPGFNLTVQNVSKVDSENKKYHSNGQLCYRHNDSIPTTEAMYVRCAENPVGNQIRLQLAKVSTQLVICDVRVYGDCKDRTWGNACENMCGFCNNLESCNSTTGYCMTGCEPGYKTEPVCTEECREGSWGENCMRTCGKCMNVSCDRFDGACSGNCQPGYKLKLFCDEECDDGWYGNNCTGQCNPECTDKSSCRKSDGFCVTVDFTTPAPTATSAAFTVRLIAGVGAAILAIIVMCAIAIFCYLKQTRNSSASSSGNIAEMEVKFSYVSEGDVNTCGESDQLCENIHDHYAY